MSSPRPPAHRFFNFCRFVGFAGLLGVAFASPAVHAQAAAPRAAFEMENGALKLPGPVLYETASDRLRPESDAALAHVKAYLEEKSYISTMRIEVHTDNDGNAEANLQLSKKRALSAGRWLIAHGIDCKRLIAVGFGSSKPIASNDTPQGKAENRRTVFANAALRGRNIGGMPVDGGGVVAGDLCAK